MRDRVVIVGGGPAGATLAFRLARLGHSVTVVERSPSPRSCDGESLHPGIWTLLDAVGIRAEGALPIHRSLVRWSSDDVVERQHRIPQLAVMRPAFDAQLIETARRAGATVLQSAADADSIARGARFVADASGRASWSRTTRTRTSEPAIAMRATWRGAGMPSEARVEALEDGWIWGSPMPDGSFAAIACVDADSSADEARYFSMMRRSSLFRDLRGQATVHCQDATTYAADVVCDERTIRIGDASHSLDPLSSSGVRSAMQSALHTSIVINTIVHHPERSLLALQFYEQAQRAAVAEHIQWTRSFYAESRWRDQPFWRKRAGSLIASSPEIARDVPLVLAPNVSIDDVPCIVGDLIEPRRGVTGAALARPFVWIGGVDAATLLDPLAHHTMTREELITHWRGIVPSGKEQAMFDALLRSGVLAQDETDVRERLLI
jgi:2-polyprenyl-6-methoxyphenol hydroxylase-like FAD-dependent oxidoreductase